MPVLTPDLFWATASELLECVCTAIDTETECPCPCRKYISVGPPVWDECCEGQIAIWLDRVFYHENFPQEQGQAAICSSFLAGEFKIQWLICAPTVHADGTLPSHIELTESARRVLQSLYVALRALACCLAVAKRHRKYIIRSSRTIGPDGGCVGWEISVTIELHDPMPDIIP